MKESDFLDDMSASTSGEDEEGEEAVHALANKKERLIGDLDLVALAGSNNQVCFVFSFSQTEI